MKTVTTLVAASLLPLASAASAQAPVEPTLPLLTPSSPSLLSFGTSVAVRPGVAFVGDPLRKEVTVWVDPWNAPLDTISAPHDGFGSDVGAFGNFVLAGAPLNDGQPGGISEAGTAHLYENTSLGIQFVKTFQSAMVSASGHFGASVAVARLGPNMHYAVVGEPGAGKVHVFEEVAPSQWILAVQIDAPSGTTDFGRDVAADGDTIVVASSGKVHLVTHNGAIWSSALTEISASTSTPDFGSSVAIEADLIAVGDIGGNGGRGSGHLFERSGTVWSHLVELTDSTVPVGGEFGRSAAVDGDDVVLFGGKTSFTGRGFVAIFVLCQATGVYQLQQVMLPFNQEDDDTGASIAINRELLIVGAPKKGRAHRYEPALPEKTHVNQGDNLDIYVSGLAVIGQTWTATVDQGTCAPNCSLVTLIGAIAPDSDLWFNSLPLEYYWLVDLNAIDWVIPYQSPVNGVVTFSEDIACQSALLGVEYHTQAVLHDPVTLDNIAPTNAEILLVGY